MQCVKDRSGLFQSELRLCETIKTPLAVYDFAVLLCLGFRDVEPESVLLFLLVSNVNLESLFRAHIET